MPNEFDLSNAGFGVEIECYLPEGETMSSAAAAVTQRLGHHVAVESYNHITRSNWKVVTDGSLGDVHRGIEFVSPILRGEDGLAQIDTVCEALTDFGCTVSKKCGLHVHVGVGSPDLSFFKNLLRLYSVFEPVLDSMLPASRRASANSFCRSMTSAHPAAVERATSLATLISAASSGHRYNEVRYAKLNLSSYARHRTVEFRHHSGTLDASKTRKWAMLCLRMVATAMRGNLNLGTTGPMVNRARVGSKSYQIGQMLLRTEGTTGREVCEAVHWPSVSLPQQARICGLEFTTQRMGREVRYFARSSATTTPTVAVTVDGFAQMIGATDDERAYMLRRVSALCGPVAWSA